jgi:hypothetical protein
MGITIFVALNNILDLKKHICNEYTDSRNHRSLPVKTKPFLLEERAKESR